MLCFNSVRLPLPYLAHINSHMLRDLKTGQPVRKELTLISYEVRNEQALVLRLINGKISPSRQTNELLCICLFLDGSSNFTL